MSRTSSAALQTLKSIASRWPVDNVRPKLQLSAAITEAASKAFGAESVLARSAPKGTRQLTKPENEWAAKFEGSMRRLLENRAMATVSYLFLSFSARLTHTLLEKYSTQ